MVALKHAHIVVFGNEKGGSGKTTTAVHLIAGLLRAGFRVASIDLDGRQRSLTRYLDYRRATMRTEHTDLPCPTHHVLTGATLDSLRAARRDDRDRLGELVARMAVSHDFIVIDCPGSDTDLSRAAHRLAHTLITPLNDSLLDLDMVVQLENGGEAGAEDGLQDTGTYALMVAEQRKIRLARCGAGTDWILLRNRMSSLGSRNSSMIGETLARLSCVAGCRIAKGVQERVIYRQLFLRGVTVLDIAATESGPKGSAKDAHSAARGEIRDLLDALSLPRLSQRLDRI